MPNRPFTPQILLTNDDGIQSPGLWAAAEALSSIGYVHVVAPREQSTGAGRSLPSTSDGIIEKQEVILNGKTWVVHAVGGSPAQAVLHAITEVIPASIHLVVAGINYGENVGTGVTISGTVGAAMEGAALGIPSLAVSLETDKKHHFSYSNEVDFSAAAYFTACFAQKILWRTLPEDVSLLKVDVPATATPATPWRITRLSRHRYYDAVPPQRASWDVPGSVGYQPSRDIQAFAPESDVYTLIVRREVAVTPLSLDMTARTDLRALEELLAQ